RQSGGQALGEEDRHQAAIPGRMEDQSGTGPRRVLRRDRTEYSPRSSPALIFQASWDRSRISIFLAQSLYAALTESMWTCTSIFMPRHMSFGETRSSSFAPLCPTMTLRNALTAS